ncbi:hypothetical protein QBC45DRAFT_317863, partial [Copromyces sp. CBS 386.78]
IVPLPLKLTTTVRILEDPTIIEIPNDDVFYYIGRIGSHFVVIIIYPRISIELAATALANIRRSFPNIKYILVVGIAGGIPYYNPNLQKQIILSNVVVGIP